MSHLQKDFTSTPTNAKKFTFSCWVHKAFKSRTMMMATNTNTSGSDDFQFQLRSDNKLGVIDWYSSGVHSNHETNRLILDDSSWYHFVFAGDSTLSTAADRMKIYVNGVRETSFSSATNIGQNNDYHWNKETSGTSNGWKIGQNAGALGTDSSGNGTTFSLVGDLKQSVSTPSNKFCTLQARQCYTTEVHVALTHGMLGWQDAHSTSDGPKGAAGNLASVKGKWYYEMKHVKGMYSTLGISRKGSLATSKMINTTYRSPFIQGNNGDGFGFQVGSAATLIQRGDNTEVQWTTDGSTNITAASDGDIFMCAADLTAGKIWWGRNGTWNTVPGSTTATSSSDIASGNNAHKTWTPNLNDYYGPAVNTYQRTYGSSGANPNELLLNFGEGRFGTSAVSSAVADGAGLGAFEYAPPSGFFSWCTKNIKDYG